MRSPSGTVEQTDQFKLTEEAVTTNTFQLPGPVSMMRYTYTIQRTKMMKMIHVIIQIIVDTWDQLFQSSVEGQTR